MIVETAFANGSRAAAKRLLEEGKISRRRESCRVVRMDAGREEEEVRVIAGEIAGALGGGEGFANADESARAGGPCARNDLVAVAVECRIGEMSVAVDEISHQKVKTAVETAVPHFHRRIARVLTLSG